MLLIVTLFSLPSTGIARGKGQELEKLNRFVQTTSSSSTAAIKVFRDGRDQIQEGEWSKAAATFSDFIRAYPSDKNVDAAIFYLAFALKNQSRYQEASRSLQRLLNEYPKSSWANDAKAMILEIAAQTNDPRLIEDELAKANIEIKIIALQSLFQTNPDRASEFVVNILKPDSKDDRRLKENALNLLGQYRGKQSSAIFLDIARRDPNMKLRRVAIHWLGRTGDESVLNGLRDMALTAKEKEISRAAVGAIAQQSGARPNEMLAEIARNNSAPIDVRKAAVESLGLRSGEVIVEELMKIYNAEPNPEIRKSVVHALSRRANPSARVRLLEITRSNADTEVRREAIYSLVRRESEANVDDLLKIYEAETDVNIRRSILHALSRTRDGRAEAKIAEIARASENTELRSEALNLVARQNPQQAIEILIQIYSTEQNNEVKREIISALSRLAPKPVPGQSDQDAVSRKLADIARNDPAPELRAAAIYAIARRSSEQAVPTLIQFYDAEKSEEIKDRILSMMCRSTNKQALRKLMEIAKGDSSVNLRKTAVSCLGRSKDPEAMKFIEEILK
jgi:HEAT repeat protein